MQRKLLTLVIGAGLLALLNPVSRAESRPRVDLNGTWEFYADVGEAAAPPANSKPGQIRVPGAWQAQGYGTPGGTIPSANIGPGTSPAEYLRHNLMARCLYVRQVEVPSSWSGQRVFLCVRRAYRYTDAAVNGKRVGEYEGFCSPFEFDITDALSFGKANQVVLGVDNRPRPGRDTLGTGNLYGNWGGIGGDVYLEARPAVWIDDVFAMPRLAENRVLLKVTLRRDGASAAAPSQITAEVSPWTATNAPTAGGSRASISAPAFASNVVTVELVVPMEQPRLWTPDDPFLYRASVQLLVEGGRRDNQEIRFGMREITAQGTNLLLNGKPLYLSGYGDDATEPLTGMLPADKRVYRQRLAAMRALGFNFVRHHSCVPHDEYLDAADEVGMLVQPEAGVAYTGFWRTGYRLFEQEWPHIVRAFRNHPSIWAWCMGNELFLNEIPERTATAEGRTTSADTNGAVHAPVRSEVLDLVRRAYQQAKELDPTRLVHASDGGTPQESTDVLSNGPSDRARKPFLLHEYGTYCCSLPNFSLIPRLDGVIRPLTYERAQRFVNEHHLNDVYPRLYRSSLIMRADAQKHYIESAKGNPSNRGYSFWLGVDFPDSPEGCWDEGILNQLWEPKPYLTNNLAEINGSTVLLTSVGLDGRSFYNDKPKEVGIRLWHYGAEPIHNAILKWEVSANGNTVGAGEVPNVDCGLGETKAVAPIKLEAGADREPRFLTLRVGLWQGNTRLTGNSWDFFSYPRVTRKEPLPGIYSEVGQVPGATEIRSDQRIPDDVRVLITRGLKRDRHSELMQRGHAAVLLLGTGGFKEAKAGYFLNQYGTGFGGIIEDHPMFSGIPHEGRLHLGLYQLVAGGGLLETESMPATFVEGSVVWGLRLTGWISPIKNLRKVVHMSEVLAANQLHLVLCNLDLLSEKPESRYVLSRAIEYLAAPEPVAGIKKCAVEDLQALLRPQ